MQVNLAFHAIPGTVIGESGNVDFSDTSDPELEGIALPHAVNMFTLKPFPSWLGFCLDADEKSVFPENAMNCSPGTRKIELVLDPSGSPCWIFPFESDDPLFQRRRDRSA